MTEQEFKAAYPLIARWIQATLAECANAAQPVASLGFRTGLNARRSPSASRLPANFSFEN